jgi:hypothetical protein
MRALRTLVAGLLVAIPAVSASASRPATNGPEVRQHVNGVSTVYILSKDKDKAVYQVQVTFDVARGTATNQASYAVVSVAKCKKGNCATPVKFLAPLASGQYKASDLKNVQLNFTALGKAFAVTLTGTGPGDVDTTPQMQGHDLDLSSTWSTTAKVTFMGVTCTDKNTSVAAHHTTFYPLGFQSPSGVVPMPAKPIKGTPVGAKSCRPGPK